MQLTFFANLRRHISPHCKKVISIDRTQLMYNMKCYIVFNVERASLIKNITFLNTISKVLHHYEFSCSGCFNSWEKAKQERYEDEKRRLQMAKQAEQTRLREEEEKKKQQEKERNEENERKRKEREDKRREQEEERKRVIKCDKDKA